MIKLIPGLNGKIEWSFGDEKKSSRLTFLYACREELYLYRRSFVFCKLSFLAGMSRLIGKQILTNHSVEGCNLEVSMEIQWYPGHMAKSRRELKEILPLINLAVEVADARLPKSSRNPDLDKVLGDKPRVLLLNKADLAETEKVAAWVTYYSSRQQRVLPFNAKTGEGLSQLYQVFEEVAAALDRMRGRKSRQLRICVVGVPNVGKSSVLNRLVRRNAAQVGNKPGVTKGRQWVKKGRWEVLDTPGLLWPKIEDDMTGWLLAFTGTIKPEILQPEELALRLIQMLTEEYPSRLKEVYGLSDLDRAEQVLEAIGRKRGCLVKGGQVDSLRAANLLWNDFRSGALGRFTLEDPPLSFPC